MDFFQEQRNNNRTTIILIVLFFAVVLSIGYYIDHFYLGIDVLNGGFPFATVVAFMTAGFLAWVSYYNGDYFVLTSVNAVLVDPTDTIAFPKGRLLLDVVKEMSVASGNPMPSVYLIPSDQPNAFATGRDQMHSSIAVTEGLLDKMNREELQAVIGHEMGHIKSRDIKTMMVVAVLLGTIVLMSDWLWRISFYGPRRRKDEGISGPAFLIIIAISLAVIAPIIGQIMAMAVSREREYAADASSVEFTRNSMALASALEKIRMDFTPMRNANRGTAHMFISDPLARGIDNKEGFLADLLSTHPPIDKRIAKLRVMSHQTIVQGFNKR